MDTSQTFTALPRFLIRLYQRVSAGLPRRCRFYPTCSEYTLQALETKGLWAGLGHGILRILKCHPFHRGGVDTVPL